MDKYKHVSSQKEWLLHQARTQNVRVFRDYLPDHLREWIELGLTPDLSHLDTHNCIILADGASIQVVN